MVHDTEYITFRAMQNPDEPDLPFAQSLLPTMYRDMQNPDEPDLPFAQSARPSGKYVYYEYIVNGDSWVYGKKVNAKVVLRETTAIQWRMYGYTVEKVSQTKLDASGNPTGTTGGSTSSGNGGLSRSQVEGIIESYHGDDILRLDRIHKEQEGRITAGHEHRLSIEDKVNKAKAEHQNIWDSLGQKSDSSHVHLPTWPTDNGNGNGCGTFDILCHIEKLKAQIGGVAIIGGVVLVGYFLLKRRIRK